MTLLAKLTERPSRIVIALCAAQIVCWTLAPSLVNLTPPIDVIEGYLWGREWVLATYKHPALPGWVLEASRMLTGRIGWPAYLVSQLFIAASFWLIYLLGRDLMGRSQGAAAALLMTGTFFFTWASPEFNHNIAQMPFWIGFIWTLWHATRTRHPVWWLLAGAFAAANLYTKLSGGLLLAVGGAWLLWDVRARNCLKDWGPWAGLALFLALVAPFAIWLVRNSFLPFDYAERRANSASAQTLPLFLLGQVGYQAGLLALLALAGLIGRAPTLTLERPPVASLAPDARAFLLTMAIGPLLAIMVAAIVMDMHLKPAWTASMSTVSGLLAIALTLPRFTQRTLQRLVAGAAILLVGGSVAYGLDGMYGVRDRQRYRPQQAAWPATAIAKPLLDAWAEATPAPLRVVIGETRLAGIVALKSRTLPSLVQEGDLWRSPWVTMERIEREGALVIWADPPGTDRDKLLAFIGTAPVRSVSIAWPRSRKRPPLEIKYAVVPPKGAAPLSAKHHASPD